MTAVLEGQLDMLALIEPKTGTAAYLDTEVDRMRCRHCLSNWGRGLKPSVLEHLEAEHAEAEPGRCLHMVQTGLTQPYYRLSDRPWLSGWTRESNHG